jgi:Flp pilus assembly protein TadG
LVDLDMGLFDWRGRLGAARRIADGAGAGRACERGSVAVHVGITAVVLIGMVALGVEATSLLLEHRRMQAAADQGAVAGAAALVAGNTSGITTEAQAVAANNGFVSGVDEAVVTVNNPPASGAYAGDSSAVQVTISQPQNLALVGVIRSTLFNMSAQAVARSQGAGRYCIFALSPAASGALAISNNAIITNPNCGVAVNSSSSTALMMSNNSAVYGPVNDHGGASLSNNAVLSNASVILNGAALDDPYASVIQQTAPSCTSQSGSGGGTMNLTPGHFCSGWNFGNNATINLAAGVYYVDTQLSLSNNITVNGTGGVTIVVNGTYAIYTGNNAVINITAPTSGTYAGIALMGPRNSSASVVQNFSNNSQLDVTGAIYFPSQTIRFSNNGMTVSAPCTQVIGLIVQAQNNLQLDNQCNGTGVRPIGAVARLVE